MRQSLKRAPKIAFILASSAFFAFEKPDGELWPVVLKTRSPSLYPKPCLDCRNAKPVKNVDRLLAKAEYDGRGCSWCVRREQPDTGVEVQFAPAHARHFFAARAGQEQKLVDRCERPRRFAGSLPESFDLVILKDAVTFRRRRWRGHAHHGVCFDQLAFHGPFEKWPQVYKEEAGRRFVLPRIFTLSMTARRSPRLMDARGRLCSGAMSFPNSRASLCTQ